MIIDFRSKNGGGSGSGGTTNYNDLENKPRINGTTLQGNVLMPIPSKTSELTNDSDFVDSTALGNEKTRAEQAEEVLDEKIVANTEAIQNKADKSTTYTKDEVDSALSSKADASAITDIDSKLQSKADSSDVNAIADSLSTTQEIVAQKANIGDSYTKDEADSKFLTEHQSLAEYAKTADIAEAYQPKGDYITEETDPVYTADKPNIALKSEIPSLDGYATEQWVENKNYITGYTESDPIWESEKGNYYTKDEVDSEVSAVRTTANDANGKAESALFQLQYKANKSDVYTKTEVDKKISDVELYKFPNVTLFGEPSINGGQLSNFSATNYAQFPFLVDLTGKEYYIDIVFTTSDDITSQQNIIDSKYGLAIAIKGGKVVCAMGTNGTSWNLGENIIGENIEPNHTYYLKLYCMDGYYIGAFSPNGFDDIWTHITMYVPFTESLYPTTIIIGKSLDNAHILKGSINLNGCSLTYRINGYFNVVWNGMDDAGLATRLATDMSNIDAEGVNKVKEIAKTEIPSLDGYATEQWVENKNYITGYTESDPVWNAEKTNYYNKTQVDAKLYNKADASTVYTKSQVDSALSNKANSSDVYTKNQVNIELAKKANTATTYTKSEVDSKVADMPLKTINGESIKGTGNIVIQGGSGDAYTKAESDALLANKTNTNLDNISDEGKENLKNIIKGSKTNLWNAGELSHTITAEEAALKWEIGLDAEVFQMWENFSFYTQSSWEIQYSPGKSDNITFSCTGSTNGITIYDKATDTKLSTDADMYLQVPLDSYYIKFDEGLDMATNYFDYVEGVFYSGTEPLLDVYTKSEIKENYYNKNDIDNKGFVTQYYVTSNYSSSTQVNTALNKKANTSLDNVSLKTINGESIKGSGDITIKGGDEHFQFNPEQDIVNGIAVYTKDEKLITIDNKNEPIPMGTAFKFDMNSIDETKYLADSMYFWTYTFNASEEKLTIHREMMYYEPNPLNIYKDGELVAKIGSTEEGGVSMYEISFSELSHYTFKPMCTVVDNWHFDDYSNETIPFVKPTLILGGDSEGAYVVRNSIKKEIATTDNYAELTFVDVDGNETTLLLLKKN